MDTHDKILSSTILIGALIIAGSICWLEHTFEKSKAVEYQNGKMYMLLAAHIMSADGRDISKYDPAKMGELADSLRNALEQKEIK